MSEKEYWWSRTRAFLEITRGRDAHPYASVPTPLVVGHNTRRHMTYCNCEACEQQLDFCGLSHVPLSFFKLKCVMGCALAQFFE